MIPFGNYVSADIMRKLIDEQEWEVRLRCVANPHMATAYESEVDRRAKLFAEVDRTSPHTAPDSARSRALQSVYNDVTRGFM
jgi:hypothetical protein